MKRLYDLVTGVPWIIGALIAPAAILFGVQTCTGSGVRVPFVAAGAAAAAIRSEDHPEGMHYTLDVVERESFAETAARVEEHIREYPDVIVIGLDARDLAHGADKEREAMATFMTLTEHAENSTAIAVILDLAVEPGESEDVRARAERVNDWWRRDLCRGGSHRVCIALAPHAGDVAATRQAVSAGLVSGLAALHDWRASTQVGR